MADAWAVLGVPRGASEAVVKAGYRRLIRQYHPDVNKSPEARIKFEQIQRAWEELRRGFAAETRNGAGKPRPSAGTPPTPAQPQPQAAMKVMTLSFAQSFNGGSFEFSVEREVDCEQCGGRGVIGASAGVCMQCSGSGRRDGDPCLFCRGTGMKPQVPCHLCSNGRRRVATPYVVTIPAGVADDTRIEAAPKNGKGATASVLVRVKPSTLYERLDDPANLEIEVPLTYAEACLGAEVEVPAPDRRMLVNVPQLTPNGKLFRLAGYGMPKPSEPGARGDLYVRITVAVPAELQKDQRRLIEQLAQFDENPRRMLVEQD